MLYYLAIVSNKYLKTFVSNTNWNVNDSNTKTWVGGALTIA